MITAKEMNSLLENRAFRAFLAARTQGVRGDTAEQQESAQRVTSQMTVVSRRRVGSFRYNLACATLLQHIDAYLAAYNEHEPPYLPKGHELFGES